MNKRLYKIYWILIVLGTIFFVGFFGKPFISADYSQGDTGTQLALSGLANGLIAYRPLDSNTYDYSININNGVASGATQTGGKLDGAYLFKGSGRTDSIIVPNSGSLNPTTGFSLQAWVKWRINPGSGINRSSILNKNGNGQYRLQHNQYNSLFEFAIQNGKNSFVQSTTHPQLNTWYHIIGTYDGAQLKLYVNGVLENSLSTTGAIQTSTTPLTLGKMNTDRYFNGIIDEVALWNRSLTTQEIQALYNSGNGNRVLPKNYLLSYAAGSNGSISGNYFQQIDQNGNGTPVTAIPDPGYHFVQRSDGLTQNPRTDTNVITGISVSAIFYEDPFVLTSGLIAYRPLDSNTYDYTINANNGIASGATATGGKMDGAYTFNGQSDYINVPDRSSLNPTSGLTVQAWVKRKTNPGSGFSRASILNKNGDSQYRLQHNQSNSTFEFAVVTSKGAYRVESTTQPQINTRYHVVGTYDGTLLRIYINGTLENTLPGGGLIMTSTNPLNIGRRSYYNDRYFNGNIDEVALWDRPLSVREIQALYNSGNGDRILPKDIILSYAATSNGSVSGNFFQQIHQNGNGTPVAAIPNQGYHFLQRSDGSTQNPRTDTNVAGDISVSAIFYEDPPVLAEGLLGYRPLDADAHDFSTNTNNGIVIGATQTGGKVDNSYTFNGQSDYINVPDSTSLNPTSGLTVQAWVKRKTNPSSGLNRSSLVNKNGDGQFRLQHNQSNSAFEFSVVTSKNSYRVISTTHPQINTRYHVVGTYDGALLRIYVNGILENTLPAAGPIMTSSSPLSIGRRSNLNDRYFNGSIDEVALWNRPLSVREIQALYNDGDGNPIFSTAYTLLYTSMPNGTLSGNFFQQVYKGGNSTPVTAIPNSGYHFVQRSDGSTQNPRTDTNVAGNIYVYPLFNKTDITHSLMYNAGSNGGILGDANQIVISGSNGMQITAIPNDGYRFLQRSDGSTQNPRTDTNIKTDISITAQFSQIITKYSVIYIAGTNGSISGDTSQEVQSGSSDTPVTAIPNSGYHFVQRSDGSTQNPRTDTNVAGNIVVSAQFNKNISVYTLSYTALPYGTLSGNISQSVSGGMNGTAIQAIANQGYHFVQRSDGSTQNPRTDTNVAGNISVYALFNETNTTHSLMYDAGINGSLYGNTQQLVLSGHNGTLVNAFPNPGYHFVQRSDGSTQNPRTDTNVVGDISVIAQYAKNLQTFTLSYTHDSYGGINGNDHQNIVSGADGAAISASPNPGYHFVQRSDGSTQNPRTDTNVTRNISVSALFALDAYNTIYLPNVGSKSAMDAALIASGYNEIGLSSIRTELTGFLVGNKKISTKQSNGKILSALIIQSPSPTNKVEIQIPAGTIVRRAGDGLYTGVINVPETISNISIPLQNVIYAASLGYTGGSIQFMDQNNNPVNVTIRMPAPGNSSGDSVDVYYSIDNGSTWNLYNNTQVVMIGGMPYVEFTTNHFTDFTITLPVGGGLFTGSFVIDNDAAFTTSQSVTLNMSTSPAATNMRFSDDNSTRSSRESYSSTKSRTLPGTYGMKTVYAQFDSDNNTSTVEASTSDSINYNSSTRSCSSAGAGQGCISLKIVGNGYGYCEYGNSLDLGITGYSTSIRYISSPFLNTSGNAAWFCNDLQGAAPWTLSISSSDLLNMTTNNSVHTISGSKVFISNPVAVKTSGVCTANSGSSQGSWINIGTDTVILGKYSSTGEVCQIETSGVDLKVEIPAYQALGQYSGTLTITVPNL